MAVAAFGASIPTAVGSRSPLQGDRRCMAVGVVGVGHCPNRVGKRLVALAGHVVVVEPKADRAGHVPPAPAPIGSNPRDIHLPVGYQRLDRNVLKGVSKPGFTRTRLMPRLGGRGGIRQSEGASMAASD